MLSLTRKIYLVVCFLVLVVSSAQADSVSAARRSIEAAYKAGDAATARRDTKTVVSFLAPDFHLISLKGLMLSRAAFAHDLARWHSSARSLKSKVKIKKFSLRNGKAIVLTDETYEVTGFYRKMNKLVKTVSYASAEETWVKIKGKWLKQRTKALSLKQYLDGKLYKPPA